MKGRREARQKKWQGRRLTHMASVTTLLPAATGSSSINWQDIFHCTITSSGVSAKTAHHRHHHQHPSTHECICLNAQKHFFLCSKLHLECVRPIQLFFLSLFLLVQPSFRASGPLALPLECTLSLFYPILHTFTDDYRAQIAPTGTFLSPSLLLQGVSKTRLFLYMPSLHFQLSTHGRRMTSTRLLKTVSADRHKKRGVNTLTVKNLPTA